MLHGVYKCREMFALRWRAYSYVSIYSEKYGTKEWKPENEDYREEGLLKALTGAWGMIIQEGIFERWILKT